MQLCICYSSRLVNIVNVMTLTKCKREELNLVTLDVNMFTVIEPEGTRSVLQTCVEFDMIMKEISHRCDLHLRIPRMPRVISILFFIKACSALQTDSLSGSGVKF